MQCLKCGRKISESQAFCDGCLQSVEKYPVRPGTVVHLPRNRTEESARKPLRKKRPPSTEELLHRQRKLSRKLGVAVALLLLVCAALSVLLVKTYEDLESKKGRDYIVSETR